MPGPAASPVREPRAGHARPLQILHSNGGNMAKGANGAKGKKSKKAGTKGLLARLAEGPVICAEGYLFEMERRGYLQAGAFVPEVVLEHPELVEQLHREFVHSGSDVV